MGEEDPCAGRDRAIVKVIIPAQDEEAAIGAVLEEIPLHLVDEVIVADNGSTDRTAAIACARGATVVTAARRGYGSACLAGLAYLADRPHDIVVFLDGDHSDHPEQLGLVLEPLLAGHADMVIGSRRLGRRERGSLLPQQILGNLLATTLIRLLLRHRYTDLGPFRAVTRPALERVAMADTTYGWTVEMQVKAILLGLRVVEVPVSYRKRIGKSKIAGTVRGTLGAGIKILGTIGHLVLAHWITRPRADGRRRKAPCP